MLPALRIPFLALLLTVSLAAPAWPVPDGPPIKPVTTSLLLPVDGVATVRLSPTGPPIDIAITGHVHVVTHVTGGLGGALDVHLNLADVTGTDDRGTTYVATGAFRLSEVFVLDPPPIVPAPGFSLMPVGSHVGGPTPPPIVPLMIGIRLLFSDSGDVNYAEAFVQDSQHF